MLLYVSLIVRCMLHFLIDLGKILLAGKIDVLTVKFVYFSKTSYKFACSCTYFHLPTFIFNFFMYVVMCMYIFVIFSVSMEIQSQKKFKSNSCKWFSV